MGDYCIRKKLLILCTFLHKTPYGTVENDTFIPNSIYDSSKPPLPETFYLPNHIKQIKLPYEAEIDVSVVYVDTVAWLKKKFFFFLVFVIQNA
jgi:hypothetical protein